MDITLFYIPVGTSAEAKLLGEKAIGMQLAACANIFPIDSTFQWLGEMQHESEFVLLLKTLPALKLLLQEWVKSAHTYEVPCIISWEVDVNDEYGLWIKECLSKES